MLTIITCEIKKLFKSKMVYIIPIGIIIPVLLNFLMHASNKKYEILEWESYFTVIEIMMNLVMAIAIFSLITSYLFSLEFEKKTIYTLFTYPVPRSKFVYAKLLTVFVIICLTLSIVFLLTLGLGLSMRHLPLTPDIVLKHSKVFILMMIMHFALVPFFAALSTYGRGMVPSVIAVIGIIFLNFVIVNTKFNTLFPWSVPYMFSPHKVGRSYINYALGVITLLTAFVSSTAFCRSCYEKGD